MKKLYIPIIVLATMAALSSCKKETRAAEEKVSIALEPVAVKTTRVTTVTDTSRITASGILVSAKEARLSFKTGGVIEHIFVEEGDKVQPGQLLAKLNLTEIGAQVAQAEESYEKAKRDAERTSRLFSDSVATLEQLQNARTGLEVAQNQLKTARFNRSFSEIRAASAGVVLKKMMNEGEVAGPGSPVLYLALAGENGWKVQAGVADRDWSRIVKGDLAFVKLDAHPGQVFSGKVIRKAQVSDPVSGLYQIEIAVASKGYGLASGLFATVGFLPGAGRAYSSVPIDALVEGNGKQAYVFVPENGKAKRLPVTVMDIRSDQVLLESGIEKDQEIITGGSAYLTDGSPISILKK